MRRAGGTTDYLRSHGLASWRLYLEELESFETVEEGGCKRLQLLMIQG